MRKQGKLKITLYSDLCAYSGYANRSTIDNDICFDKYGIPYIPARRIKGCFQETADLLKRHPAVSGIDTGMIFGAWGSDRNDGIKFENAHISGYENLCRALDCYMKNDPTNDFKSKEVLDLFTSVRAQTSMRADRIAGNGTVPAGVAKDDSLRFTRVVNEYLCLNQGNENGTRLSFEANISYEDVQYENYKDGVSPIERAIKVIARSTRHIGLSRNRGYGSVVCEFEPDRDPVPEVKSVFNKGEGEDRFFVVKNTEPLMISAGDNNCSETRIPARNVIGALAAGYLAKYGKEKADSDEFRHLFLDGTVKYSDLIIMDGKWRCIPAPLFVNELKKSRLLVNSLRIKDADLNDPEQNPQFGNQPKKLKGKYVSISQDGVFRKQETDMAIIYHNRHIGSDDEKGIYTQVAVSEGQRFGGYIHFANNVPARQEKDLNEKCSSSETIERLKIIIDELISEDQFRFGKSKTAQYGRCILEPDSCVKLTCKSGDTIKNGFAEDSYLLVSLVSDGIFANEQAYTVNFDEVYSIIAESLKIKDYIEPIVHYEDENKQRVLSMAETGLVFGYNSKWNMRMCPVPAILAGSTFVYKIKRNIPVELALDSVLQVGERQTEGYGEIRLFNMTEENLPYILKQDANKNKDPDNKPAKMDERAIRIIKAIAFKHIEEYMKNVMLQEAVKNRLRMSSATIGRITLMLHDSRELYPNDAKLQFLDFAGRGDDGDDTKKKSRVRSIKRAKEREEFVRFLKGYFITDDTSSKGDWKLDSNYMLNKILSDTAMQDLNERERILGMKELFDPEELVSKAEMIWSDLVETYLTAQKYGKKN